MAKHVTAESAPVGMSPAFNSFSASHVRIILVSPLTISFCPLWSQAITNPGPLLPVTVQNEYSTFIINYCY